MHKLVGVLLVTLVCTFEVSAEGLSKADVAKVSNDLRIEHLKRVLVERKAEMASKVVTLGDLKMPFWYKTFGQSPAGGRSLYISLHGGGGAPAAKCRVMCLIAYHAQFTVKENSVDLSY